LASNEVSQRFDSQTASVPTNFDFYTNSGDRNTKLKFNQGIYSNSKNAFGKNVGRSTIATLSSKSLVSASNAVTMFQGQNSLESLNSINDHSIKNEDIFGHELGGIYGLAPQNGVGTENLGIHRN
jgi:hypothetical protein